MLQTYFNKIGYYFNRSIPSIKILGFSHFLIGVLARICKELRIERLYNILSNRHINNILGYIDREIAPNVQLEEFNGQLFTRPIIWICWWQGIDNAPALIRNTVKSIIDHTQGYDVIFIDKENISTYLTLPTVLVEKLERVNNGNIQHLTDIIRMGLISQYGGIWMDANILMVSDFNLEYSKYEFYSCHPRNIGRWHVGLIGGTNPALFKTVFKMMIYYWENHEHLIDYFFTDRLIQYCYSTYPRVATLINTPPQ